MDMSETRSDRQAAASAIARQQSREREARENAALLKRLRAKHPDLAERGHKIDLDAHAGLIRTAVKADAALRAAKAAPGLRDASPLLRERATAQLRMAETDHDAALIAVEKSHTLNFNKSRTGTP